MNANVVCILGMHRSGTSLVARLTNLLGIYLGPETRLVRAAPDNPKGFWEHRGFLSVNERILAQAGGSWKHVPSLNPGWEDAPELQALEAQARTMISTEFGGRPSFGFKDPRTCLTLPFWQKLLPGASYVLCIRNPIAVARSLERRDHLAIEQGVKLWLEYLRSALQHTRSERRTFVFYEKLLANWRPELERLARFLGRSELAEDAAVQQGVGSFIDAGLQHNHDHLQSPSADWLDRVRAVYAELESGNSDVLPLVKQALRDLEPVVREVEQRQRASFLLQIELAKDEIARVVPRDDAVIVIDDGQWGLNDVALDRRHFPFLERDGAYWGLPPDDTSAIRELERLRSKGAKFVAFGAPSFWWFGHYRSFHDYLRSQFRCVSERPSVVVFELRPAQREPSRA